VSEPLAWDGDVVDAGAGSLDDAGKSLLQFIKAHQNNPLTFVDGAILPSDELTEELVKLFANFGVQMTDFNAILALAVDASGQAAQAVSGVHTVTEGNNEQTGGAWGPGGKH
jgi:hypothetical protein